MKALVYYQDLSSNYECYDGLGLIVNEDGAILVGEITEEDVSGEVTKESMVDAAWKKMNNLYVPVGHKDRPLFRAAGHTSMSVGDYLQFEDGEIWVCANYGWEIRK